MVQDKIWNFVIVSLWSSTPFNNLFYTEAQVTSASGHIQQWPMQFFIERTGELLHTGGSSLFFIFLCLSLSLFVLSRWQAGQTPTPVFESLAAFQHIILCTEQTETSPSHDLNRCLCRTLQVFVSTVLHTECWILNINCHLPKKRQI